MDSFNYFNELSAYGQARQLWETYQADKDEIKTQEGDVGGMLGLGGSTDILSKSLLSDNAKTALTKLLKTGNQDVDNAVENTVKGITADSNPVDILNSLASQLKPVLKQKATDFVKNALAKVRGQNKPQSDLFGSDQPRAYSSKDVVQPESNLDQTQVIKNPAFEPDGLLDDLGDETAEASASSLGRLINAGRSVASNVAQRLGVDGEQTLNNLTNRVSSAGQDLFQRASGVLEDGLERGKQMASDVIQRGNNLVENAQDQVENTLGSLRDTASNLNDLLPEGAGGYVNLSPSQGYSLSANEAVGSSDLPSIPPEVMAKINARAELPFPEAEPPIDVSMYAPQRAEQLASTAQDQVDVAMARLNPSGSTSTRIGDLLRGNVDIPSTADAETSQIGQAVDNLASTGRSLIEPAIADLVPDSLQGAASTLTGAASDALTGLSGASDAILGASSVEEGIGAALDSTGVLAPIGALLGFLGIGGSLAGILDHHASRPSFGGAIPAFEPGL